MTKVPQLRFKGFSGEWEEKKLGELVEIKSGWSPSNFKNGNILFIKVDDLNYSDRVVNNTKLKVANSTKYSLVNKRSIIFPKRGAAIMTNKVRILGRDGYMDTNMMALSPIDIISDFLYLYIGKTGLYKIADTSTIPQINNKHIEPYLIQLPNQIEQTKIGNYFQQLDKLIEQKEKKHQKLRQFKKAMLSKMFPKNGADTPEIRFKGFSDKWEEKRFKDNIVSIQTGTNLLGSTTNKGMPLIKMGNIQRGYFSFEKVEYLNENTKAEIENIANYGDFLFNTRNTLELVGKGATWMGNSGKLAFNNNLARFTFNGIDTIFFNYLYNTQSMISQVQARAMGTTSVAAIYPKNLNSIEYYLPDLAEQTKIGNYFQQLDTLIDLHQKELQKLKNIKKASLVKMFV